MQQHIFGRLCAWLVCMLLLSFLPWPASAQTLTLYEAVTKAVTNYPLLQQRQAEVAAGKAHLTTVNDNRLPSLVLHEQATLGTDNPVMGSYFSLSTIPSTPGSYTSVHNNPNPGNTAISYLKWDFYTFGYYNAQQKQAKSQLAVTEAVLNSDKYQLTENMISLYLDWLKKYRLMQIGQQNLDRAKVTFSAIRATVISGLKPGVDSSTASAVYADATINYLQAQDNYNYDKIIVASYTGIPGNELVPDTAAPALFMESPAPLRPVDSVGVGHPLLAVYQKQYEQQLADSRAISRKYLPHIGIDGATWVRNSGISPAGVYPDNLSEGMPYSRYNYLLGLTLSYNVFDLKHRHDELAESRFQVQAREGALQNQQLQLNRMMAQANSTYLTTTEKLKAIPVQLSSARLAYGQQTALYKAGLNTLIDVTNAQYALLQAETNYVIVQDEQLQLQYIRAGLGGQLDDFLQNFKR